MALNIDVGKIKFTWKGTYDAATSYEKDDVVYHSGDSWICVIGPDTYGNPQTVTGTAPSTTATQQWNKMAQGADLGAISGLANGDLFYYNGTDFVRLPVGTTDQVLKVTGGVPAWGAGSPAQCWLIQRQSQNQIGAWQTGTGYTDLPGFSMAFTPRRTDTIVIFKAQFLTSWYNSSHAIQHFRTWHNGSDIDYWTLGATYYEDIVHYEKQMGNWSGTRTTKLRTREYSSNGHMLRFFETQYWDGGGGDQDNTENRCTMEEWLIT